MGVLKIGDFEECTFLDVKSDTCPQKPDFFRSVPLEKKQGSLRGPAKASELEIYVSYINGKWVEYSEYR